MKILILDNYDSFTYNLFQYLHELNAGEVHVFRNDEISLEAIGSYDAIVLSPGPGIPEEAGIMPELINRYKDQKPIFGVCLGHQGIGEAFGGELYNLPKVYHGIETAIHIQDNSDPIFQGIPTIFQAGRYHSWVVNKTRIPICLKVTAIDDNNEVMAFRHEKYPIYGVQFHPESVMTPEGKQILRNFLNACQNEG